MIWLYLSAAMMVITAIYHSQRGEKLVIRPLLSVDHPMLQNPQIKKVLRWAWHMASYFMAAFAIVVVWPETSNLLILVIGIVWLAIGASICFAWRGTHKGSYMLMAAGIFAGLGVLM